MECTAEATKLRLCILQAHLARDNGPSQLNTWFETSAGIDDDYSAICLYTAPCAISHFDGNGHANLDHFRLSRNIMLVGVLTTKKSHASGGGTSGVARSKTS